MTELDNTGEQPTTDSTGTTGTGLEGQVEQSVANSQTTVNGPVTTAEESFFDPKEIMGTPLEAAYKQMQGAFTKRMHAATANQHKIDAYDAFESNPAGTLQQLAQQYGYHLIQPGQDQQDGEWQPNTWDEVMDRARKEVMKEIQPLIKEVQGVKQSNMESYMDNNFPDWRTYEDNMLQLLKEHPTLSKSPDMLYDMALPPEVKRLRAIKEAQKKIQGQTEAAAISGKSTTTKQVNETPNGIRSLDEAVDFARQQLAAKGIRPPRF